MTTANPKDLIGRTKLPIHLWPPAATAMGCIGLAEGLKYGRNNWRAQPISFVEYYNALMRHMMSYLEGEDVAGDSMNPHLCNALATLAIIVDAKTHGTLVDDRNFVPGTGDGYAGLVASLGERLAALNAVNATKNPHHYTIKDSKDSKAAAAITIGFGPGFVQDGSGRVVGFGITGTQLPEAANGTLAQQQSLPEMMFFDGRRPSRY